MNRNLVDGHRIEKIREEIRKHSLLVTVTCPCCRGKGVIAEKQEVMCDICHGRDPDCPACRGKGRYTASGVECSDCFGMGTITLDINDEVERARFKEVFKHLVESKKKFEIEACLNLGRRLGKDEKEIVSRIVADEIAKIAGGTVSILVKSLQFDTPLDYEAFEKIEHEL